MSVGTPLPRHAHRRAGQVRCKEPVASYTGAPGYAARPETGDGHLCSICSTPEAREAHNSGMS